MATYNECRCIGEPLRFVRGECFTCGRFLPGLAGRLNADEKRELSRPGLGALLEAVHRTQDKMRTARPAPRHGRRVVIEPAPTPQASRRKGKGYMPRSRVVGDLLAETHTF